MDKLTEMFPNIDTAMVYMIGGVLIATAIVIFGWRLVKGMTVKNAAILVALVVFVVAFVLPNLR